MIARREPVLVDQWAWTSSIVVGLGFLLLFSLHSLLGVPTLPFVPLWPVHGDTWMATSVTQAITHGSLAHLYRGSGYDALPLWPILLAPVVMVAEAVGRSATQGAHPSMAALVVPYTLAVGVLVLHAGRALAWSLGTRRRLWLIQLCLLVVVVLPCAVAGHMEDGLAVAFLLYSLRRYQAGQLDAAALLLALAISSKQWAILALPLLVAFAPPPRRVRFAALSLALPALLGAAALALDFAHAYPLLLAPSAFSHNPGLHLGATMVIGERGSRLARPVILAASLLIARNSRRHGTSALMPALAATLLLRPLLEPLLFAYYLSPGVAVLAIVAVSLYGQGPAKPAYLLPPVALIVWALDTNVVGATWWAGALLLLFLASRPALRIWRAATKALPDIPARSTPEVVTAA